MKVYGKHGAITRMIEMCIWSATYSVEYMEFYPSHFGNLEGAIQ